MKLVKRPSNFSPTTHTTIAMKASRHNNFFSLPLPNPLRQICGHSNYRLRANPRYFMTRKQSPPEFRLEELIQIAKFLVMTSLYLLQMMMAHSRTTPIFVANEDTHSRTTPIHNILYKNTFCHQSMEFSVLI